MRRREEERQEGEKRPRRIRIGDPRWRGLRTYFLSLTYRAAEEREGERFEGGWDAPLVVTATFDWSIFI